MTGGLQVIEVKVKLDLPPGVELLGYERCGDGHGNEEEVAQRLGISAETVALIVENQLQDDKQIDPKREIKHVGMDELSLKKRHKLSVTVMTDLTDPKSPKVLAVARGRGNAPRGHGKGVRPGMREVAA